MFNCDLDWKSIYTAAADITKNSYLLQTQFRLTHNILPSNEKLHIWKKREDSLCACGSIDTNFHYCVTCENIKPFWNRLLNFIRTTLEMDIAINDIECYFGVANHYSDVRLDSINFVLLVARTFIWSRKRYNNPCLFIEFLLYLKETLLIEGATRIFKRKKIVSELIGIV